MADIDAALMQQILDIPQREREPDIHHNRQADDLSAGFEILERITFCHAGRVRRAVSRLKPSCSDKTVGLNWLVQLTGP
ncbi:hypothetical protein [Roseovarius aestuariivivens]|uniref:hypothetical protein n=1 Tax=Roseovarius aestuariivivens TaxID=1888910 RepID=UPI001FD9C82B|nr:hypothetical protein [Roseovarius aestuariivivens]